MKTVGQIIKKIRQEKDLDLSEISRITKIQIKYLNALEKDAYSELPSSTTARGFIRNYGIALGIAPDTLLALFRRDFTENKVGQIIPRAMSSPASPPSFYWTPRHTIVASVCLILGTLAIYLYREYRILSSPPQIIIEYPKSNAEVKSSDIEIRGKTEPEAQLTINGEKVKLSQDGSFFYKIKAAPGENTLTFFAKGARGKSATRTRTVQVVP